MSFGARAPGYEHRPDEKIDVWQNFNKARLARIQRVGGLHLRAGPSGARPKTLMILSSCARIDERGKAVIEMWGELPRLVDAETAHRLSFPWLYTSSLYATSGAIERVVEEVFSNPFPPSPGGIYHQSRAITGFDSAARLGQIKCPTLVVVGNEDILSGLPFSEQLARGIRGSQLVVLEKCAHGLLTESPEATATAMLGFLPRDLRP